MGAARTPVPRVPPVTGPAADLAMAIAVLNGDWSGAQAVATRAALPAWWEDVTLPVPATEPAATAVAGRLPVRLQVLGQRAALVVPWVARRVLLSAGVHNRRY